MYYDEQNRISITGGSRGNRRPAPPVDPDFRPEPSFDSDFRPVVRPNRQSNAAIYVVLGIVVAAILICSAAVLLTVEGGSLPSLGLPGLPTAAGIPQQQIQEAVDAYLLSGDNPMRSLHASTSYQIKSQQRDQSLVQLTITVVQETEKTYYACDLVTKWKKDGLEYTLVYLGTGTDQVCYPLQAPGGEAEAQLAQQLQRKYPEAQFQMDFSQWRRQTGSFTAQVTVTQPQLTYIHQTELEMTMHWRVPQQAWQIDGQTLRTLEQSVDFSPLNGTWNGVYSHPTTYLRADKIPFTVTFSNAGKVQVDSTGQVNAPVTVEHTLNQLWDTYQTDSYNVNYESGNMSIQSASYGYYLIEFEETNVDGIFEHPCKVKIYPDRILFEDALVGYDTYLKG